MLEKRAEEWGTICKGSAVVCWLADGTTAAHEHKLLNIKKGKSEIPMIHNNFGPVCLTELIIKRCNPTIK